VQVWTLEAQRLFQQRLRVIHYSAVSSYVTASVATPNERSGSVLRDGRTFPHQPRLPDIACLDARTLSTKSAGGNGGTVAAG
jgi:hypothetical protein